MNANDRMQVEEEHPSNCYGMATLVYKHRRYFIEGKDRRVLETLFSDPLMVKAITHQKHVASNGKNPDGEPADDPEDDGVESVLKEQGAVNQVKHRAVELGYPLFEEYDFKSDKDAKNLPEMHLKNHTKIRSYQSQALSQMLGNGRARSGMIVLPCGAGKTLTGVTAASTIRKSVLVLTTNATSVRQWKEQFQHWTTIPERHISIFTRENKDKDLPENSILISTYPMISFGGDRAQDTQVIMDLIHSRIWGLLLMDEAHVVPAQEYRRAVQCIKARCKLGLTATMVREDDKIADLTTLIGPKLYQANWKELTTQGYLANVQCIEVWCPMTQPFREAYQKEPHARRKMVLCGVNPNKLRAVELLVRYHEGRGDKIIVFSDSIFTLEVCAEMLKRPYLYGQTKEWERQLVLETFRKDTNEILTICLSKIGDVAIDLPKANVVIQVTSQDGGRRQEAQRLGRILRPKFGANDGGGTQQSSFDAFFYTLVATDTQEMAFAGKRQQFLVDQGYSFEVVKHLCDQAAGLAVREGYAFATAEDDQALLGQAIQEMRRTAEGQR